MGLKSGLFGSLCLIDILIWLRFSVCVYNSVFMQWVLKMSDRSCAICDRSFRANQHAVECSNWNLLFHKRVFRKNVIALHKNMTHHGWEWFLWKKCEVRRLSTIFCECANSSSSRTAFSQRKVDFQLSFYATAKSGCMDNSQIDSLLNKSDASNKDVISAIFQVFNLLPNHKKDFKCDMDKL